MTLTSFPGHVDAIYTHLKKNFPIPCKLDAFVLFELDSVTTNDKDLEEKNEVIEYLKATVTWLELNGYLMGFEKEGLKGSYTLSEKWLKAGRAAFSSIRFS